MPERLALYLQDTHPLRDAVKYVQYAETRGFEAVWQAETRFVRDAVVPMAAYAATTLRIKIASGVLNHWTRNAATIAAMMLTLDDLAPDRITCGLGAWDETLAGQVGIVPRKPLLAMREIVTAVRDLLAGHRVTRHGEFVQFTNAALDVVYGRKEVRAVPLYLSSNGAKMTALAGEIADGVLLEGLVSPSYTIELMDELTRGLHKAGRSFDRIDRPQIIYCAVDRDAKLALNIARRAVTLQIAGRPQLARACGVPPTLIDEILQVLPLPATAAQITDAMRLVPDEVVQLLTAAGDPDTVRAKVRDYLNAGATCPALFPLCDDVRYMIDVFADPFIR